MIDLHTHTNISPMSFWTKSSRRTISPIPNSYRFRLMDRIEKIGRSLIQHGKLNDRVYIMKLYPEDLPGVIGRTEELCGKENYSKVFAKIPESLTEEFYRLGYMKEGEIDRFYRGEEKGLFLGKFLSEERKFDRHEARAKDIFRIAGSKSVIDNIPPLGKKFTLKKMGKQHTKEMAGLYRAVFASYPFPVFDEEYLKETMDDNLEYAGIFHKDELVSIASAEKYPDYMNAEMTDFATLPEYRGNNFSVHLLKHLESSLKQRNYKTLYTIARAKSAGMNITFKKCGYRYSGTLVNNTNISGEIESMNVWHRYL